MRGYRRLALVALLLTASTVVIALRVRSASGTTSLRDNRGSILSELERSADAQRTPDGEPVLPLRFIPLDEEQTQIFFPGVGKRMVYDPVVYSLLRPNVSRRMNLAEYPGGGFDMRTNSLGLREDAEPAAVKPDLRILVTGDSHTDGVVPNSQSFANQLERLLAQERPERSVEVLNAGVGGYSFYNYLGVPERWASLQADILVVGVYGGNDFAEIMPLQRYFHGRGSYATGPYTIRSLVALEAVRPIGGIVSQDALQVCYFANNPTEVEVSTGASIGLSEELHRRATEHGMELLFVYIPPATRGQPVRFATHARVVREEMGIDEQQLAVSDTIADRWIAGLAEAGIPCIDMRPLYREARSICYWRLDLHINVAGHALIAEALNDHLRGR